jgi:hypothetical protein
VFTVCAAALTLVSLIAVWLRTARHEDRSGDRAARRVSPVRS